MAEDDLGSATKTGPQSVAQREPWSKPQLLKISAGSAENGFSQNIKDGQFTKS